MRRIAVLLTLVLSFVVPLAIPSARASEPGSVRARASDTSCRSRRAKKRHSKSKPKKAKKKDKKPYGFEL
ncbi:MAG: hypothetical protein JXP73_02670 [Deltaproteobacteria bacterium]|nr:hypothetical protein [Deltaproteobacteria bacterium]